MITKDIPVDERRGYIGGSDAPVILGLSKWKTRTELYLEKRGEAEAPDLSDNEPVRWGNILEPVIAEEYSRRTGFKIMQDNRLFLHRDHLFIGAHVDGISKITIRGATRILECKSTGYDDGWGEPGTDQIPDMHYAQVQHYLGVMNATMCDVAVLIRGNDFRIYHVTRNDAFIDALFAHEIAFWKLVQDGTPPEPITNDEAALAYPNGKENAIETDLSGLELYEDLCQIKEAEKDLKAEKDKVELAIKKRIGDDADTLTYGGEKLVTWKHQTTNRFNSKLFKEDHPDEYEAYREPLESRILRLTKRKTI